MADNTALRPLILESDLPAFAVLDGAQFDDLPNTLFEGDFVHRPLYLDRGNGTADQLRTAPQLVWLDKAARPQESFRNGQRMVNETLLDALLELLKDRPAAAFWQCSAGGDILYRHLRGINKVLYPKPGYLGRDTEIPESGFEMVTFRHADANVLAQISSSLDWNGLSRLLGPAEAILFTPDQEWSPKSMRAQRHDEMPSPHNGPLKIGRIELRNMARLRFQWLARRTIKYLNEYASGHSAEISDEQLKLTVETWLRRAQSMGVTEEPAFRKYCYMQLLHEGELEHSQFAKDFEHQKDKTVSADERVHQMMKYMIERAEAA